MMLSACGGNPFLTEWKGEDQFPPFDKIKLVHYVPAVKAGIRRLRRLRIPSRRMSFQARYLRRLSEFFTMFPSRMRLRRCRR